MKSHDPHKKLKQIVHAFIQNVPAHYRLALVLYDQYAELVLPLESAAGNRKSFALGLKRLNYAYPKANSPAAIERAIYELNTNSDMHAKKIIVFLTDGGIDTGDVLMDYEKAKWLREVLVKSAVKSNIRIYSVGLTDSADYYHIQLLADTTGGAYFHVNKIEELKPIFTDIQVRVSRVFDPLNKTLDTQLLPGKNQPMIRHDLAIFPIHVQLSHYFPYLLLAFFILLGALIWKLLRINTSQKSPPTALLRDMSGITGVKTFQLSEKPTLIGRVHGDNFQNMHYIVIHDATIGRRHAIVHYRDHGYWITDQGSVNGTYVNNKRIFGQYRLASGDNIKLNDFEFEFTIIETISEDEPTYKQSQPELLADTQERLTSQPQQEIKLIGKIDTIEPTQKDELDDTTELGTRPSYMQSNKKKGRVNFLSL